MKDMKPAHVVVLHDSNLCFTSKDGEEYDFCGEYGGTSFVGIDTDVLLALLDAIGIKHRQYIRDRFSKMENRIIQFQQCLENEELNLFNRIFRVRNCEKLEIAEYENGFIRIQITRKIDKDHEQKQVISHFGPYSVIWESD